MKTPNPVALAFCLLPSAFCPTPARAQTHVPDLDGPGRVVIRSTAGEATAEHDLIGPNVQPEWTTRRVFAETDVYVLPPGNFEVNQSFVSGHPRHGVPANLFETEFEAGLPFRTEFDVELNYSVAHGGRPRYDSTLVELPHALAPWGRIPFNPTVDAGWRFIEHAPDAYFFRLLLAEEFNQRLHFGANLTFDRQIGGARQTSFEFNHALSAVVIENRLSLGYELRVEHEREQAEREAGEANERPGAAAGGDDDDDAPVLALPRARRARGRFEHETSVLLGPSVLFRPTRSTYLSVVSLFGLTRPSPVAEVYCLFGVEFGPRRPAGDTSGDGEAERAPLSRRRR